MTHFERALAEVWGDIGRYRGDIDGLTDFERALAEVRVRLTLTLTLTLTLAQP